MATPTPTGRIERRGDARYLVFERLLAHPIEQVWASATQSDQLDRWIGRYDGDPASGAVNFYMTSEGSTQPEHVTIAQCRPPRHLEADTQMDEGGWSLQLDLQEAGDGGDATRLVLTQLLNPGEDVTSTGPGWDYYLDRHAATLDGLDLATLSWGDYFPALGDHYAAQDSLAP